MDELVAQREQLIRKLLLTQQLHQAMDAVERLQHVFRVGRVLRQHLGDDRRVELNALDGGDAEELPLLFGQAFQLAIDHAAQGLRHVTLDLGSQIAGRPPFLEVTHQIGHEERVAFGLLVNLAREPGADPGQLCRDVLGDVRLFQKGHHQLAQQAVGEQIGLEAKKWMLVQRQIRRPVADEKQQPERRQFFREVAQQIDRREIGPVHVVEEEHDGAGARQLTEQRDHLPHQPVGGAGRRIGGQPDLGGCRRDLCHPPRGAAVHQRSHGRVARHQPFQRLEKRQVCFRARQALGTPTGCDPDRRLDLCEKIGDQRALPDPRLASDGDELADASRRPGERRSQIGAFMRSADGGPRRSHEHDSVGLSSGSCQARRDVGRRRPQGWLLLKHLAQQPVELGAGPRCGGRPELDPMKQREGRFRLERVTAGNHLEQHQPEREHVARRIRLRPAGLFRRHVAQRADDRPRLRRRYRLAGLVDLPCESEVQDLDVAIGPEHHVLGLDVPMHHATRMRCGESAGNLRGDASGLENRQGTGGDPLAERLSFDELRDHERPAVKVAEIVDDQDVRMVE